MQFPLSRHLNTCASDFIQGLHKGRPHYQISIFGDALNPPLHPRCPCAGCRKFGSLLWISWLSEAARIQNWAACHVTLAPGVQEGRKKGDQNLIQCSSTKSPFTNMDRPSDITRSCRDFGPQWALAGTEARRMSPAIISSISAWGIEGDEHEQFRQNVTPWYEYSRIRSNLKMPRVWSKVLTLCPKCSRMSHINSLLKLPSNAVHGESGQALQGCLHSNLKLKYTLIISNSKVENYKRNSMKAWNRQDRPDWFDLLACWLSTVHSKLPVFRGRLWLQPLNYLAVWNIRWVSNLSTDTCWLLQMLEAMLAENTRLR